MTYKIWKKTNLIDCLLATTDNHPCFYYIEATEKSILTITGPTSTANLLNLCNITIKTNLNKCNKFYFRLTTPLTEKEMHTNGLTKTLKDGKIEFVEKDYSTTNKTTYNTNVDLSTYDLIKAWGKSQPEGCEEAFICLGIENKTNKRYLDYLNAKLDIINKQSDKKIK